MTAKDQSGRDGGGAPVWPPAEGAGSPRTLRVLALVAVALVACDRGSAVTQPIAFNHRVHVESGLDCGFCHEAVESAAHAGIPATDTCMVCHEDTTAMPGDENCGRCHDVGEGEHEELSDQAKLQHLAAQGEPIPWRRIYDLPDHVYFSHRRHVTVAGIGCPECHGDVAGLDRPAPRPLVHHDMDWCMRCHETRGASNDCIHCHR